MPPRARLGDRLTEQNLTDLASALAAGKRATVYLNDATPSLGLPAGCSAKVVAIDGTTVLIRPKGVNDELPFEADELRMTRNAAAAPAAKAEPAPRPARTPRTPVAARPSAAPVQAGAGSRPVSEQPAPQGKPASSTPTVTTEPKVAVTTPAPTPADPTTAAAKRPRRVKEPVGVSVTLHAEAGGEWTVTVTHGAKRPGKAAPVTAEAVERAVNELGDPTASDAVASVLSAAREAAAQRVQELSKQLEEARTALESLGS